MLCPEVWNFNPPAALHEFKRGSFSENPNICENIITPHHFNHLISVCLPNASKVPDSLTRILNDDCEYYRVKEISVAEFLKKEFIEAFIKEGHLSVFSDNTLIDVDNCLCITCSGQLVLSLLRETYLELGVEGRPSSFSAGTSAKFVVTIDLCSPSFTPGKNNYERVKNALSKNLQAFNVLLQWESPNEDICPSSVGSYLYNQGYSVELCKPKISQRIESKVNVPLLPDHLKNSKESNEEAEELLEWLGVFSLQADLIHGSPENFVSNYEIPSNSVLCDRVILLEWRGFFSVQKIFRFYTLLREYGKNLDAPWISLHVQGFADSPLSWGNKEHSFFTEGDNHYTLFLQPSQFLACTIMSSHRGPKR